MINLNDAIKSLWGKITAQLKSLWDNSKLFFFVSIPLILLVKFRSLWINWLVDSAKNIKNKSDQKDITLSNEINNLNTQADQIINDANSIKTEKDDGTDWYKK